MKYKAYINGQPYRMRRGSDGYNMNTYIEALVFVTCFYDDAYFSPNMAVDVDGVVHYPDQNGRLTILGEKGTSKTLALTYDGKTQYIDVTFDGGTYEAKFYGGVESLTFTIQGSEANYIDCTTLKTGTWQCKVTENGNEIGVTKGITIPLPDSTNQALIFQTQIEPVEDEYFGYVAIFYYRTDNSENRLDTHYGYISDYEATFTFTLSRTGD